jgi:hypothetical protein
LGDRGGTAPSGGVFLRVPPRTAEPSWGRVLATTVRLFVARRWRTGTAAALATALVAVAALWFTGVLAGAAAPAARVSVRSPAPAGNAVPLSSGAATRSRAAAWIAGQVGANAIIACYPDMCAVLQAHGVMAGRLMPLRTAAASPRGAGLLVTSPSTRSQGADEYAPAVIASFGSGDTRVDVRAAEPGGTPAYAAARRADLQARRSAGSQLLQNRRLEFTARDAGQLRAGAVDSRLLATLAALASQHSFRVTGFGAAAPGVQVLFRAATLTSSGNGTAALGAAAALVRAQAPPYLPANVTIVQLATGQTALTIEFAAPSPLGLLTAVL